MDRSMLCRRALVNLISQEHSWLLQRHLCAWSYTPNIVAILFNSWVIFHCVYVPQLPYPFICWWTSRLLHVLAIANHTSMNIGVYVSFNSGFFGPKRGHLCPWMLAFLFPSPGWGEYWRLAPHVRWTWQIMSVGPCPCPPQIPLNQGGATKPQRWSRGKKLSIWNPVIASDCLKYRV